MRLMTGAVAIWLAWVGTWLEPIPSTLLTFAAFALGLRMFVLELRRITE